MCAYVCVWCVCVRERVHSCVSTRVHVFVTAVLLCTSCCLFMLPQLVPSSVEVLDVSLCEPVPSPQQMVPLSFLLYRGTLHLPTVKKAFGLRPDTLLVTQLGELASIDVGCHDNTNKLNMQDSFTARSTGLPWQYRYQGPFIHVA